MGLAWLRELLLHLLAAHQLVLDARRLDRVRALEQQPRVPLPAGGVVVRRVACAQVGDRHLVGTKAQHALPTLETPLLRRLWVRVRVRVRVRARAFQHELQQRG